MMTEEWAMLWYQCLSENYDYSMYADARIADDVATCRSYEQKFELIAEIYNDFGKLDSLMDFSFTPESWWWQDWFSTRRHLFMPQIDVLQGTIEANEPSTVVLSIPLTGALDETIAAANKAIEDAFARIGQSGTKWPKYRLREEHGQTAVKLDQVRHAVITSISKYSYQPSPQNGESVNSVSIHFLQLYLKDMGWRLGDQEMDDLMQRGYVGPERQDTFRTLIRRHRKLFRDLSRNTVRGSFPDKRPFHSLVWDRFQNEQTYK